MGWLFNVSGTSEHSRYARDLYEDRGMRVIHSTFGLWVFVGLLMPFGLGYLIDGTLAGALTAALWGGPVRIFALHHVTWSINSVCHFFGTRRFAVEDQSTNVFWLSLLSFGESWHHNHHAFPRSAQSRAALVGDRPDRLADPRDAAGAVGVERGGDHAGAAAAEAGCLNCACRGRGWWLRSAWRNESGLEPGCGQVGVVYARIA